MTTRDDMNGGDVLAAGTRLEELSPMAGDAGARASVPAGPSEPAGSAVLPETGPEAVSRWRLAAAAALAAVALAAAGPTWWVGVAGAERQQLAAEAEATAAAERRQLAAEAEATAAAERQRLTAEAAEAARLAELRRPGRVFRDCDGCPEMVVIPSGEFQMGSPASEEGRDDSEGPQHRVTVRSFALGVTEVTEDEWMACVRNGCPDYHWILPSPSPVTAVNWWDAQAYVSWLSAETGVAYRLPSESEWEYAARAGTTTPFHTGATISTDQANYNGRDYTYGSGRRGTYRGRPIPAGTFAPNAFGLYDMHGNAREWVEDCWHDSYRGAPSDGTAWVRGEDCVFRVLRGGRWHDDPRNLRSAARSWRDVFGGGFRVARTLD